jgi:prolyl-tRNA synthetase
MNAIGGQEMEMPVVHPADLWRESGRYQKIGPEMVRFKDRGGRDMVLAMTHEEVVADLIRDFVKSYRQLPAIVYHFQTVPRRAAISRRPHRVPRVRHEGQLHLDADKPGWTAATSPPDAYEKIFARLGLHTVVVGADVGIMGGSLAHEFMVLNEHGEDTLVICDACGYAANQQIATITWPDPAPEELLPTQEVATPEADTIAALAQHLGVGTKTAKPPFRDGVGG